jgi:hypothetical protein
MSSSIAPTTPLISPDSTQYALGYALDMWNEYSVDGCHELASGPELKAEVIKARAEHATFTGKTVDVWKDRAGRLQYTLKN